MAAGAGTASRLAAATALGRVLREGAYSHLVIHHVARDLEERDHARAQRLLFEALRHLPRIDRALTAASTRPLERIDPALLDVLRVAAADMLVLGTPPHAAVQVGVSAAGTAAGARSKGFANAVLRRVAAGEAPLGNDPGDRAVACGVARWIRDALVAAWDAAEADAFLTGARSAAPVGIVARHGNAVPAARPVPEIPGAGYLESGSDATAAAAERGILVMDPASAAVARAVGVRPGERVLDVAAAPGGKTVLLWDALEGTGMLVAADRSLRRLQSARRRLERIGVRPRWITMDGTRPALGPGTFDRILLDAPCTGLGTLRRRPEIAHRLRPDSPREAAALQRALLAAARRLIRPGGRIVYSVCTVFPEETVDVVRGLPAAPPEGLPGRVWGNGRLLGPHLTGTDGMFVSVIEG